MSFSFAKIFWILMDPGALLVLSLCLGTVFIWKGWTTAAKVLLTPCALFVILLSLCDLHQIVARPLEERFPAPKNLPSEVDGIIVLGGTSHTAITLDREQPAMNDASERLSAFISLSRQYPKAKLMFTGGSAAFFGSQIKEADLARSFLQSQGMNVDRITFERNARNTYENAINSRKMVGDLETETWVLVTSATHMPRSVGAFRAAGWTLIPFPVDYRTTSSRQEIFSTLNKSLPLFSQALKEWLGLIYYRVLGHSKTLFPAPVTNVDAAAENRA